VFVPYHGHRLPLADGVCDRVTIHDAYHHPGLWNHGGGLRSPWRRGWPRL